MKILDALIGSVNYPLGENNVLPICIKRNLDPDSNLSGEIANSKEYELAYADCLKFVATMVNLAQGGGSVTQTNADQMIQTANAIYAKYGEMQIGASNQPTVNILSI
jgi:hypothetical protein